jgi:hypothetical protein
MASRKRAYLDDFKLGDDGSYRYEGTLWRWAHPERRAALLGAAWRLAGGAAACLVGAGFVPLSSMAFPALMTLPYVAAVVSQALVLVSLWRVWRGGSELRDHVYQKAVPALPAKVTVAMVAAFAGGIGALVNLALSAGAMAQALPFAALLFGCGVFQSQLLRKVRDFSFVEG